MVHRTNKFMNKTLFKKCINDISYTPVISRIYIVETTANSDKVNADISKFGEKSKRKRKVKAVSNARMKLGYM